MSERLAQRDRLLRYRILFLGVRERAVVNQTTRVAAQQGDLEYRIMLRICVRENMKK